MVFACSNSVIKTLEQIFSKFLLLTLNIVYALFRCFLCWLWISKYCRGWLNCRMECISKRNSNYIFCCLNFLLFSLSDSENCIFISDKFRAFGNAPLMFKVICKTLLMLMQNFNFLFLFVHSKLLFSENLLLKKNFC